MEPRQLLSSSLSASTGRLIFGDVVGGAATPSKTVTFTNGGDEAVTLSAADLSLGGNAASQFSLGPLADVVLNPGASFDVAVAFSATQLGPQGATLQVGGVNGTDPLATVVLRGLGTKGEQGDLEPSLQWILDTYQIASRTGDSDPVESTLDINPLANDEVEAQLFTKAGPGPVTIEPIAVYSNAASPALTLGYYTRVTPKDAITQRTIFTVPSQDVQTVSPRVTGNTTFDPGPAVFGLYSIWPAQKNRTVWSQDFRNTFMTNPALQRMFKVYPLTNPDGSVVPNAYVVGNEEASNHDYQDAVYIIRNVKPAASTFPQTNPATQVTTLVLVNADTGQDIAPLVNGQTIDLTALGGAKLSVRAETDGLIGSVKFVDGAFSRVDNAAPFLINGEPGNMLAAWSPAAGSHKLVVTPYAAAGATGAVGIAVTVTFNVVSSPIVSPPPVSPPPVSPPPVSPPPVAQALVLSSGQLNVAEGSRASVSVRLAAAPSGGDIIVSVGLAGDSDLTLTAGSQQTITFNAANWNVGQTIELAAAQDADTLNGTAVLTLSSAGLDNKTVAVTELDDDFVGPRSLHPVADAYTRDGSYATTNYGSATQLQIKQSTAGWTRESYLRFDLSDVATIGTAKLRLYGRLENDQLPSLKFNVLSATATDWSESSLTWNTRPVVSTTVVASATVSGITPKWYEIDLTSFLKQRKAAGATAVSLVLRAAYSSNALIMFDSNEGTNRPELLIS